MLQLKFTRIKEWFRSFLWLFKNMSNFRKELYSQHEVVDIRIFKFFNWHVGACYFSACLRGDKIFIKTDYKLDLLKNEINAYAILSKITDLKRSLLKPVFHDEHNFHFIGYRFVDAITLEKFVTSNRFSQERFDFVIDQIIATIDCFYEAGLVHRDLKPDNIFVRNDCSIIVFDYLFAVSAGKHLPLSEIALNRSDSEEILSVMGTGSQTKRFVWDDAHGIMTFLIELNKRFGVKIDSKLPEVQKRIGRLQYSLDDK
jgi:serine/threonine protein kinase